jgi:hypothetical protein
MKIPCLGFNILIPYISLDFTRILLVFAQDLVYSCNLFLYEGRNKKQEENILLDQQIDI